MPSLAERAYIAATIHTAVTTSFAHAEALPAGYDFDTEFRHFLDEGMAAQTRIAFDKAAMRLMSSLRNGHTKFIDLALQDEPALPFRALRIDGHWIVTATLLSDRGASLDPGDEITTMDGASFDAWATAMCRRRLPRPAFHEPDSCSSRSHRSAIPPSSRRRSTR